MTSTNILDAEFRVRNKSPLDNNCLTPSIIYEAKVSNETNDCKRYFIASETPFKERFSNHTRDFKHKKYDRCTELSKHIWTLNSHGITSIVKWSIVERVTSKTSANYCQLCLTENFSIIRSFHDTNLLNKKYELENNCGHQNKLLLLLLLLLLLSSNIKRNYYKY